MVRPRGGAQVTVDDWVQAGYAVLAEDGFAALKIDNLCRRLGMTKGSFYHHFADVNEFQDALIASWAQWRDDEHRVMEATAEQPPRERLGTMMQLLASPTLWTLERAMREWARSDERAAASVAAADRKARTMVRQVFLDLGFPETTAARRAGWAFALGIGALHLSDVPRTGPASATERAELVDFLLRP